MDILLPRTKLEKNCRPRKQMQICSTWYFSLSHFWIWGNTYFLFYFYFQFFKIANLYFHVSVDWACGGQPGGHIAPRWQIRPNQRIWKIQKYFAFNILAEFWGVTLPQYWKRTADNKGIKKKEKRPWWAPSCLDLFGTIRNFQNLIKENVKYFAGLCYHVFDTLLLTLCKKNK